MKKIKNVLLVLLMLIVANTMGFADPVKKQFEVNTSIPGVLELKVAEGTTAVNAAWGDIYLNKIYC